MRRRPKNLFVEITGAGNDPLALTILGEYERAQNAFNAAYGAWLDLPEDEKTDEPPDEYAPEGTLMAIARKHGWPGLDDEEWRST